MDTNSEGCDFPMNAYSQLLVCDIDVEQFSVWLGVCATAKALEESLNNQEDHRLKGLVLTSKEGILIYPFKHSDCMEVPGEYNYAVEAHFGFTMVAK